ncbi:DNA polymerase III subunit delta' [candidate division KSB3 bacterium]|uniref:DNA polymerase III subunit delta' n=1 Tax=candidate division KSB3 bacterium TaxID=2044937 RepID=A0A2G6E278_9BACT|nr:MAG: DNA polymerase III subunit delta' [candidate division KSB3 bacterium]PIE28481.1 MAG: DNA polymerase III subunit delta' [candidate division KSB3 bacterium]
MAFSDILGQEKVLNVLRNALRHDRVPQAYVFAGSEGVGKKFSALMLAKALNCREKTDDACDRCVSCRKVDTGNHPDVRTIEADGQFIKIDQIRDVQKDAGYKAFEGRRKVYIIDRAGHMRDEAANALLKTLEEPTAECVIILVTANVHALLPTVLSRCQLLRFAALSVEKLAEFLVQRRDLDPQRARVIASLSEGCPGRALSMDADALSVQRERLESLLQTLSSGLQDVRILFQEVEVLLAHKDELHDSLDLLQLWYRDMHVLRERGDPRFVANSDALACLQRSAEQLSPRQIRRLFEIVSRTKSDILRNANVQLSLEVMLISLTEVYNDRSRWREVQADRKSL